MNHTNHTSQIACSQFPLTSPFIPCNPMNPRNPNIQFSLIIIIILVSELKSLCVTLCGRCALWLDLSESIKICVKIFPTHMVLLYTFGAFDNVLQLKPADTINCLSHTIPTNKRHPSNEHLISYHNNSAVREI